WEQKLRLPARAQVTELTRLVQHWLLEGNPTAGQVAERMVIDWLLHALPRSHHQAVGMRNPSTTVELVEAIKLVDAAQHQDKGERAPPFPQESRPAAPSPRDKPSTKVPVPSAWNWLAGCIIHNNLPIGTPEVEVKINAKPFCALLDSGSAASLVQPHILAPRGESKAILPITCVHRDTRRVPARRVTTRPLPAPGRTFLFPCCSGEAGLGLTACSPLLHNLAVLVGAAKGGGRCEDHVNTPTVYHPQTDGLVERFNQTLKQMLRRVVMEDKRNWDLMLPYILFGIRELPQASTGFTPFELLFGQQPRGLLDRPQLNLIRRRLDKSCELCQGQQLVTDQPHKSTTRTHCSTMKRARHSPEHPP
ncbi:hypothetical protein M9458_058232, partial [Cirrhinus mrigala]